MSMSVPMQRAYDVAKKYDENLKAIDPRFNSCVRIIHDEGTTYWFERAFLMTWKDSKITYDPNNADEHQGEWLFVFTEHQGLHVFTTDDLYASGQYTKCHMIPPIISD